MYIYRNILKRSYTIMFFCFSWYLLRRKFLVNNIKRTEFKWQIQNDYWSEYTFYLNVMKTILKKVFNSDVTSAEYQSVFFHFVVINRGFLASIQWMKSLYNWILVVFLHSNWTLTPLNDELSWLLKKSMFYSVIRRSHFRNIDVTVKKIIKLQAGFAKKMVYN